MQDAYGNNSFETHSPLLWLRWTKGHQHNDKVSDCPWSRSAFCVADVLCWPKSPFSFFCKIKDRLFILTYNCIDLDILSLSVIYYWPGVLLNIFPCTRQPHSKELFGQSINSTKKLHKPLLTRSISHRMFSITTQIFIVFQFHVYLSWNNKA